MNYSNINWNQKTYQQFLMELKNHQDISYQAFTKNLVPGKENIIGIRMPILKQMAKEISSGDYQSFIEQNIHHYYEECMIHGLILGYIKIPMDRLIPLIAVFIPFNDTWSINDSVTMQLKQFKKEQVRGYQLITEYLHTDNPWKIRFALILLLAHYVNDTYIDEVLTCSNQVTNEHYYVKMANAWLISLCYIKYKEKTKAFLKTTKIDDWTYQKAIQKTIESTRIGVDEKEYLRSIKRNCH